MNHNKKEGNASTIVGVQKIRTIIEGFDELIDKKLLQHKEALHANGILEPGHRWTAGN